MSEMSENLKALAISTIIIVLALCFGIGLAVILSKIGPPKQNTQIEVEKHLVTGVSRHIPRNVQEEMNLYYDVTIDGDHTFKTLHHYQVGDTIYYEIHKINR